MARAYLLSHGARVDNAADTFVPPGRSISFYSEYDENTLRSNGLAALNAGDIPPTETFAGGATVPNYLHVAFSDAEMAEHLTSQSSRTGGALYFVGGQLPDPAWLCTTPSKCATTFPDHHTDCDGLFARIAEDEIVSVACRGLSGGPEVGTETLDGSTEFIDDLGAEAERILEWARQDPDAAWQYYRSLSEPTRVMLNGADTDLAAWVAEVAQNGGDDEAAAVIEARNYLAANGDETFADYADQWDPTQRSVVLADGDLLEAYWTGNARRTLHREGAPALWEWYVPLDPAWQAVISADQELADGLAIGSQGGGIAERSEWSASDDELAAAREYNEQFVKDLEEGTDATWEVAQFVVLLGRPDGTLASRLRQQPDYATGTFQVERSRFGAGSLVFDGVAAMHQGTITYAVEQFSRKDVRFE